MATVTALHWALGGVYAAVVAICVVAPILQPSRQSVPPSRWVIYVFVMLAWPIVAAAYVLAAALVGTTRQLREWLK